MFFWRQYMIDSWDASRIVYNPGQDEDYRLDKYSVDKTIEEVRIEVLSQSIRLNLIYL